jgi:RNA polymerase sigma-70 factor (ECF subfamily)
MTVGIGEGLVASAENFATTLAAARTGAEWAWTALYRNLAPPVLGFMRARGATDAEDLTQEVFVAAVRGLSSFEGNEENFRSWIFVIAHRRLLDERRKHSRHPVDPTPMENFEAAGGNVEDEAMESLESEQLRAVLSALPPLQRDALLLRIVGRLSAEEVGEIVGKSAGAVKQLQRRGLQALARLLAAAETEAVPN